MLCLLPIGQRRYRCVALIVLYAYVSTQPLETQQMALHERKSDRGFNSMMGLGMVNGNERYAAAALQYDNGYLFVHYSARNSGTGTV